MHFPQYPRIGRDLRADTAAGVWCATEKLHGAHLVVAFDGNHVRFGKRKAWLADDEPFFGWQLLRASMRDAVRSVAAELGAPCRLHGELIGGAYPHPDVPSTPGLTAVQTGCWYQPDLAFVVFDVVVDETFLAFSEVEQLVPRGGLPVAPLLLRGSRTAVLSLPAVFQSRWPALRRLPPIDGALAEGFVARPDVRCPVGLRPIAKRKHPDFDDARFDDSAPWAPALHLSAGAWEALATQLLNPARVASARSKVGLNHEALAEELVLDVLIDLQQLQPVAFEADDAATLLEPLLRTHAQRLSRG